MGNEVKVAEVAKTEAVKVEPKVEAKPRLPGVQVGKVYKDRASGKLFKVAKIEGATIVFNPWTGTKALDVEMHTDAENFELRMEG